MHEWINLEIFAILLALIIIILVSLAFTHHITLNSNQRSKKIQNLGIDVGFLAKKEEIQLDFKSMLVTNTTCVICQDPTTRRCSRCKSIRYCSYECQVIHWKGGHKNECHAPELNPYDHVNKREIMCNGNHFEPSKNVNSTIQLNPIKLGVFKSANKKINDVDKRSLPNLATRSPCNLFPNCESLPKPKILLYPYNYFIKLFEWNGLSVPCGLINCGNSCFANVVLQCLTYTRPLTAYLLNGCHMEDCKRNDWCFMCELQSHVCKVRHNQNPFSPIRILSRIRNIGNHLGYGKQEDAHEFMRFAIDSMQSICLDEFGGEKVVDHATQETTLIHHIFGGHLRSQVKCMECEHESNCYESMMDLAVEIHGIVESLEDALAQFTTTEVLDGDNKYKCDCCNAYVKARKQLTIHEAPNILTIALKRFQSGKFGKLNKRVTFPDVLNISPYMSGKTKETIFYRLYAVVVHVDMLNASFFGHYICYVKDSDGIWYKIDDNKVKEVELEKVLTQRAYMLFYNRSEARVAPTIQGKDLEMFPNFLSTSTIDRTSVYMESHRNSIFPPTLGTISVPVDLTRNFVKNHEPIQFDSTKKFNYSCKDNIQTKIDNTIETNNHIEESTNKEEESTSMKANDILNINNTIVYNEEPSNANMSSNSLIPLNDSINFNTSNEDCMLEDLNCKLSSNGDIEQVDLHSNVAGNDCDLNIERAQSSHEHLSLLFNKQSLNNDYDNLNVCALIDDNYIIPHCNVQNIKIKSSDCICFDGVNDLCSSDLQSISNDHSTICKFPCTLIETKQKKYIERCSWDDVNFERDTCQYYGDTSGRLKSVSTSLNGEFDNMDIDFEDTSSIQDILVSQQIMNEPIDDRISLPLDKPYSCEKNTNRLIPSSSNVLLKLESLHLERDVEAGSSHLKSSQKIDKIKFESTKKKDFLEDSFITQKPNSQDLTLIEETQNLPSNVEKESPIEITSESSIGICEEPYNSRQNLEDDVPYVLVEPLRIHKDMDSQKNMIQHSMEMFSIDLHDTIMEPTKEVTLSDDFSNNNIGTKEQTKMNTSVMHTKFNKQVSKPLFFPGFLIKSSKSTLKKSSTTVNNNVIKCEENIEDLFHRSNEGLSHDKFTNISIRNDKKSENKNLDVNCTIYNHVLSNGDHGDGKNEFNEKSKDLPIGFGRENCVSILMNKSRSTSYVKQGRDDNCTCGSQQKSKKCCGKAITLEGGLTTKQVKV